MYLTHVCLRNQILVQRNPARQRLAFNADVSHWNGEEFLSTDINLLKEYVHTRSYHVAKKTIKVAKLWHLQS